MKKVIKQISQCLRKASGAMVRLGRILYSKLNAEDKAGLYLTMIFHLVVIIVLLAFSISSAVSGDSSYLFDFSRQEEEERQLKEENFKDHISRRLDELLASGDVELPPEPEIRNIAVDASEDRTLKDDRNTDAERLYADAARLQQELQGGNRQDLAMEDMRNETVDLSAVENREPEQEEKAYKGPSVVSYSLDGRKASSLSTPAYRCMGGGEVTVIITVDNSGRVVNAKVMDEVSSSDECLRKYAIRAARLSRFSSDPKAPARQMGEIVYRFIPQY